MAPPEDLHRRAVAALNARRFPRAAALLDRAAKAARAQGDVDAETRVAASRAFLEYETGDPSAALAACADLLRSPGLAPETQGIVQCQWAMLLLRHGETAAALEAFDAGIGSLSDPVELGRAHINRGGVHLAQGRLDAACADFERARAYWTEAGRENESAMAQHNLGYACYLRGDLVAALRNIDAGVERLTAMSAVMAATVNQDRAEVLLAAGLRSEGRAALRAAAEAFGRRRMTQRRAEAELALARTWLLDDPARARLAARDATRRFVAVGAEAWAARAEAVALAATVGLGRPPRDAEERGAALEAELRAQGLLPAARQLALVRARVLVRRGDGAAARGRLRELRVTRRDPLAVRLLAADVRAELETACGRPGTALGHLRRGLDELHEWQSSFGSLDLRTNVVGQGARLAKRGLELAVASRSTAVLFEWSERARMLASRVQPVHAPPDEELAAALAELRAQPAPDREAELRRRIRERAWQQGGSGQVMQPLSLSELRNRLGEAALVAYVVTDERVVALVVTAQRAVRHELGSRSELDALLRGLLADLDMAASELAGPMAGAVRLALASRLGRLADVLVEPLLADIGERPVVLTPSGVLAGLPWTLLEGYAGRPMTVAQSATSWVSRRATPLRLRNAGFVAGPRVERAEEEVVAAAKQWTDARVLAGAGARTSAVSDLAEEVDVLHLAAHGRHSAENPLFSGVELVDGAWFGYDIDCLDRVPDVVILSACEVGRSSVRWGEELIGMSTAWLHAGARCVIASAAAVNDGAACETLVSLHEALAAGAEPATALASALRRRRPGAAPAPFVCFG